MSRLKNAAYWTLSAILGLMFVGAGGSKIAGAEMQVQNFTNWGLPQWFRPVTGFVELVAALLLFVPKTRFYGGAILAGTMAGAIATHLISGVDVQMVGMNAVLGALGAFIAWTHRPDWLRQQLTRPSSAGA
jgi:uncharacterized membrane protein YphA (DoxX/SURF4 family)